MPHHFFNFFHFCSNSYISLECRDSDVEFFLLQLTCNRIMVLQMVRILISTIYHTISNFYTHIRRNNESSIFYLTYSSPSLNSFYSEIFISFEIVTITLPKFVNLNLTVNLKNAFFILFKFKCVIKNT